MWWLQVGNSTSPHKHLQWLILDNMMVHKMNKERDVDMANANGLMDHGTREIGEMVSDMDKVSSHLKDKFIKENGKVI